MFSVHSPSDGLEGQAVRVVLQDLEKVLLHVLEDEVELPFSSKGFLETHNVGMPQHTEYLDLPQGCLLDNLVILCIHKCRWYGQRVKKEQSLPVTEDTSPPTLESYIVAACFVEKNMLPTHSGSYAGCSLLFFYMAEHYLASIVVFPGRTSYETLVCATRAYIIQTAW